MWMWLGIAMIATVTIGAFGYACVVLADDPDDDAIAEYEAQRAEFERFFK